MTERIKTILFMLLIPLLWLGIALFGKDLSDLEIDEDY